jgi:hypothetical protein
MTRSEHICPKEIFSSTLTGAPIVEIARNPAQERFLVLITHSFNDQQHFGLRRAPSRSEVRWHLPGYERNGEDQVERLFSNGASR